MALGRQMLRMAEAARNRGDDIVDTQNEELTTHAIALNQERDWARQAVAILDHQCKRFERWNPQQAEQAAQAPPAPRSIAPFKKAADAQGG